MRKSHSPEKLPLDDIKWEEYVSILAEANRNLAEYNGVLQGMVNPHILLSPLMKQEAVQSSKIEGTKADLEDVLEYEADPSDEIESEKEKDIQEIVNYRKAMGEAIDQMEDRPMNLNLIKGVHFVLLDSVRGKDKARGEFRREEVWLGSRKKENARYVPPPWEEVEPLMDNLEQYYHADEEDALVQVALLHAQFEIIHPFLDGNGRVGRILIPLFLYEKGILSQPMFYISAYIERNRDEYIDRLKAITADGDWSGWIHFFLDAIIDQANDNMSKAKQILDLYNEMKEQITDTTGSKYDIQILDELFNQPIFSSSNFKERTDIPRSSANRIINELQEEGVITVVREARGRKPALYMFPELINIVENHDHNET